MNCTALKSLIALYVEGDLPVSDLRPVETHLQSCTACNALAEDLRESQSIFKALRVGTVNASDLADVRERVLNEVGDLEPAPGWVVAMHRLFFAGFRRKAAIAGVVVAVLISGSVWYSQKRVTSVAKHEASIEVATLEVPSVFDLPVVVPPALKAPRIAKRAAAPETLVESLPEIPAEPVVLEPIPPQIQVSQVPPMKFVTDDPNIIIYWLPTDKGD
jgi:anti-sigma factor RsiW